jgi:hypothetical protein
MLLHLISQTELERLNLCGGGGGGEKRERQKCCVLQNSVHSFSHIFILIFHFEDLLKPQDKTV